MFQPAAVRRLQQEVYASISSGQTAAGKNETLVAMGGCFTLAIQLTDQRDAVQLGQSVGQIPDRSRLVVLALFPSQGVALWLVALWLDPFLVLLLLPYFLTCLSSVVFQVVPRAR